MLFAAILGPWNLLDLTLVILLTVGLGILRVRNARRGDRASARSLRERSRRTLAALGVALLVLAVDWVGSGRSAAALGLGRVHARGGEIGSALAALLIIASTLSLLLNWPRTTPQKRQQQLEQLSRAGLVPQSRGELLHAIALALAVGFGAEILYRGFLVWAFAPFAGLWGAVVLAALSYGLGHGDDSWRRATASTVSAFVFTIAYALTASLWWLIVIHTWIALQAAFIGYRASCAAIANAQQSPGLGS